MYYIDPHIHMVSRTTDDYETLAKMGCVAVSEPAFWAGYDRGSVDGFRDYFEQLTAFEPKRAGGLRHPALHVAVHQREGSRERRAVARSDRDDPGVSRPAGRAGHRRDRPQQEHAERGDRVFGARRSGGEDRRADPHSHAAPRGQISRHANDPRHALRRQPRRSRERVLVDHVEEHTVRHVLDEGFWAGMTLYPVSKCTPARAANIVEMYGPERLLVNSAGDWGPSKPTAVPDFILEMRRRGHRGEPHPPHRVRESADVLWPEPRVCVRATRRRGTRGAIGVLNLRVELPQNDCGDIDVGDCRAWQDARLGREQHAAFGGRRRRATVARNLGHTCQIVTVYSRDVGIAEKSAVCLRSRGSLASTSSVRVAVGRSSRPSLFKETHSIDSANLIEHRSAPACP